MEDKVYVPYDDMEFHKWVVEQAVILKSRSDNNVRSLVNEVENILNAVEKSRELHEDNIYP